MFKLTTGTISCLPAGQGVPAVESELEVQYAPMTHRLVPDPHWVTVSCCLHNIRVKETAETPNPRDLQVRHGGHRRIAFGDITAHPHTGKSKHNALLCDYAYVVKPVNADIQAGRLPERELPHRFKYLPASIAVDV